MCLICVHLRSSAVPSLRCVDPDQPGPINQALHPAPRSAVVSPEISRIGPCADDLHRVKDLITPSQQAIPPVKHLIPPVKDLPTPEKHRVTPEKDLISPSQQDVSPWKDLPTPSREAISPQKDPLAPSAKAPTFSEPHPKPPRSDRSSAIPFPPSFTSPQMSQKRTSLSLHRANPVVRYPCTFKG
jgi:hypothetical protein